MSLPGNDNALLDGSGTPIKAPKREYPFLSQLLDRAPLILRTVSEINVYQDGFFFFKNDTECVIFKKKSKNEIIVTYHNEPVNPYKINTLLSL